MYPGHWAVEKPQATAVVNTTTGEQLTWRELNDQSNQMTDFGRLNRLANRILLPPARLQLRPNKTGFLCGIETRAIKSKRISAKS